TLAPTATPAQSAPVASASPSDSPTPPPSRAAASPTTPAATPATAPATVSPPSAVSPPPSAPPGGERVTITLWANHNAFSQKEVHVKAGSQATVVLVN